MSGGLIGKLLPSVFSPFGVVSIFLWGLAYAAAARAPESNPAMSAVFAVEKAVYVVAYVRYHANPPMPLRQVFANSFGAGAVLVLFGPNDLFFGCVFLISTLKSILARSKVKRSA